MNGLTLEKSEQGVRVHVPMTFRKRSGRKEVIVPDGLAREEQSAPDYHEALVIAISRAHRWKRLLDEGRYASVAEMARALKMNRHYVARMLRFTLLAPDIIEAVLDGREPESFSLNRLVSEIPMLWDEQVEGYGFEVADHKRQRWDQSRGIDHGQAQVAETLQT